LVLKAGDATAKCEGTSPIIRGTGDAKLIPLGKTACSPKTFEFSWEPVGKKNGTHHRHGHNGTHPKTTKDDNEDGDNDNNGDMDKKKNKHDVDGFVLRLFDTENKEVAKHRIPASQIKALSDPKESKTGILPVRAGFAYDGPKSFKVHPKKGKGNDKGDGKGDSKGDGKGKGKDNGDGEGQGEGAGMDEGQN
jgi:hypothetical protein